MGNTKGLVHNDPKLGSAMDDLPFRFFQFFVMSTLRIDLLQPGRILCSLKVPARLINDNNSLRHGASVFLVDTLGHAAVKTLGPPSTGVSLEVNVSFFDAAYLDEEIEIDSNVLRLGKTIAVVNVEIRKKSNGKIIAQGRLTNYTPVSSKL
ncbi:putative esterase F42H10.6 [Cucumis sativus]|uniref:Acyl-coenzyme A thioesterase 13 n=1 Tax=Cucumis sativus TaxID=3659 RepID=A0A0A0LQE5_CUCSA|nr:putative esterase F42H10.6 [Cucumis sativus]KGN62226.1 hypothetical protein Csa_016918 [Cucumis sativus]